MYNSTYYVKDFYIYISGFEIFWGSFAIVSNPVLCPFPTSTRLNSLYHRGPLPDTPRRAPSQRRLVVTLL